MICKILLKFGVFGNNGSCNFPCWQQIENSEFGSFEDLGTLSTHQYEWFEDLKVYIFNVSY